MNEINDGGPAFPYGTLETQVDSYSDHSRVIEGNEPGMTLRDYFAAKAMQGLCTNESWLANAKSHGGVTDQVAGAAYEMTDAMLAARGDDRLDLRELVAALLPYAERQIHADLYAGGVGMEPELELLRKARAVVGAE